MNKDLIIKTLIGYKLNNLSIEDAVKRIEKASIKNIGKLEGCFTCIHGNKLGSSYPCCNCVEFNLWEVK